MACWPKAWATLASWFSWAPSPLSLAANGLLGHVRGAECGGWRLARRSLLPASRFRVAFGRGICHARVGFNGRRLRGRVLGLAASARASILRGSATAANGRSRGHASGAQHERPRLTWVGDVRGVKRLSK